jgi:hypothetical protein
VCRFVPYVKRLHESHHSNGFLPHIDLERGPGGIPRRLVPSDPARCAGPSVTRLLRPCILRLTVEQKQKDNFKIQYATLEDPFPAGLPAPQWEKYGPLAMWGFADANDLGTTEAQNANIRAGEKCPIGDSGEGEHRTTGGVRDVGTEDRDAPNLFRDA